MFLLLDTSASFPPISLISPSVHTWCCFWDSIPMMSCHVFVVLSCLLSRLPLAGTHGASQWVYTGFSPKVLCDGLQEMVSIETQHMLATCLYYNYGMKYWRRSYIVIWLIYERTAKLNSASDVYACTQSAWSRSAHQIRYNPPILGGKNQICKYMYVHITPTNRYMIVFHGLKQKFNSWL